jgi:diketogulonate reductase-like aldo/keto reductase
MATRRTFLEFAAASMMTAGLGRKAFGVEKGAETKNSVPYRILGRSGEKVSMVGIGGYHLGKPDQTIEESIRIIRTALDEGINFLDNCWDYNAGESEIRMGKALRDGYRHKSILDDKDRWPRQINCGHADQRIAEAPSDRPR